MSLSGDHNETVEAKEGHKELRQNKYHNRKEFEINNIRIRLQVGNKKHRETIDMHALTNAAENGQHLYAIVICCSDSRVITEQIFEASIGELFVICVAGNVLDNHQLGSIEYAAGHLHCKYIIVLGYTGCGAVAAALSGGGEGYIKNITDDILEAVGEEKDPYKTCCLNVEHAVDRLRRDFDSHPEIGEAKIEGAVYDIRSGNVKWL